MNMKKNRTKTVLAALLALALIALACENPSGGGGGGGTRGSPTGGTDIPVEPVDPRDPVEPNKPVAQITIKQDSTKRVYQQNEPFAGAVAIVRYEDGTTETLSTGFKYICTWNRQTLRVGDFSVTAEAGAYSITVQYGNQIDNLQITVTAGRDLGTVTSLVEYQNAMNQIGANMSYSITISGDIGVPGASAPNFGSHSGVTVTLKGTGKLYLTSAGTLFNLDGNQTLIIDGPTLEGIESNNRAVIRVDNGAALNLWSGAIQNNIMDGNSDWASGVHIEGLSSSFIMAHGTIISGNETTTATRGGAVYVSGGFFDMVGGTISNNSTVGNGGGVYIHNGILRMYNEAIISGNRADNAGGGVYVYGFITQQQNRGSFVMYNGEIKGNTAGKCGGGVARHKNESNISSSILIVAGIVYGKNLGTNSNTTDGGDTKGHAAATFHDQSTYIVDRFQDTTIDTSDNLFLWNTP